MLLVEIECWFQGHGADTKDLGEKEITAEEQDRRRGQEPNGSPEEVRGAGRLPYGTDPQRVVKNRGYADEGINERGSGQEDEPCRESALIVNRARFGNDGVHQLVGEPTLEEEHEQPDEHRKRAHRVLPVAAEKLPAVAHVAQRSLGRAVLVQRVCRERPVARRVLALTHFRAVPTGRSAVPGLKARR